MRTSAELVGTGLFGEEQPRAERTAAIMFAAAIAGAEIVGAVAGVVAGAVLDGLLLLALVNAPMLGFVRPASRLPVVLGLIPLLRIVSVALPLRQIPQLAWYPLVGAPVLLAVVLAARMVNISRASLRARRTGMAAQAAIAISGIPIGGVAYLILRPRPLVSPLTWHSLLLSTIVLLVFAALIEELIFRWLLQDVAVRLLGPPGLVLANALYASTYAGSLSAGFALFMGAVGLAFAVAVRGTGLLWGVVAAHALLDIGLLVIWPSL